MRAKLLFPLTIIALIVIFVFAVQPIQAAPAFQTVPTARPDNSPGGQLTSPTASEPTPTQTNSPGQDLSAMTTIYICGVCLFLDLWSH